jgi:hypothetical protein
VHHTLTFYDYRDIMRILWERPKKRWCLNLEISYGILLTTIYMIFVFLRVIQKNSVGT